MAENQKVSYLYIIVHVPVYQVQCISFYPISNWKAYFAIIYHNRKASTLYNSKVDISSYKWKNGRQYMIFYDLKFLLIETGNLKANEWAFFRAIIYVLLILRFYFQKYRYYILGRMAANWCFNWCWLVQVCSNTPT